MNKRIKTNYGEEMITLQTSAYFSKFSMQLWKVCVCSLVYFNPTQLFPKFPDSSAKTTSALHSSVAWRRTSPTLRLPLEWLRPGDDTRLTLSLWVWGTRRSHACLNWTRSNDSHHLLKPYQLVVLDLCLQVCKSLEILPIKPMLLFEISMLAVRNFLHCTRYQQWRILLIKSKLELTIDFVQ